MTLGTHKKKMLINSSHKLFMKINIKHINDLSERITPWIPLFILNSHRIIKI
jgi:hypothetical protein